MLRHLRVTNFAILSDVGLDLTAGFNALTGETGAGKSLIVEAVNLLRGGRASADIPRAGADEAVVEAIVEIPAFLRARIATLLADAGLPDDDGELLVRRVIHRGGRSRTYINGALTTAKRLSEIGALLIDLSGQHQHQGLSDPQNHRTILDAFAARPELGASMARCYERLAAVRAELRALAGDGGNVDDRIDYLRFQLGELDTAELHAGEDQRLADERARLLAVDKLEAGAAAIEAHLYGDDGSAVERIDAALIAIDELLEFDASLSPLADQVREARALVEDAARSARRYARDLDGDPQRLRDVEDRLDLIRRLARKHGGDLDELIARTGELRAELAGLENRDGRAAELAAEHARAEKDARAAAAALTESRRSAAKVLASQVGLALAELGMAGAVLTPRIEPRDDGELGPHGVDRVELLLSANAGEPAKPLAKVASGGELSRIMLALKLVLRRADEVACYVFDEVDSGVGGATAEVVGRQIRAVADHRQVLCVTHLPQIAAFADAHFHVSKSEVDGRTETTVDKLSARQRQQELARMLGGLRVTPQARAHAKEMLAAAQSR